MGCGASVVPPATQEQKVAMMTFALKEMMIDIGTTAIVKGEEVKVKAPLEQLGKIREFVPKLQGAAAEAKEKMSGAGGGASAAAANIGGGMGSMLGKVAGAVDKAADAAGSAAGSAMEAALNALAGAIQSGIDTVDKDFENVGKEVAGAKVNEITAVYKSCINDITVLNPEVLVRGASPHGPDEAKACAKDAVSQYLTSVAKADLIKAMYPACKEAVEGSTAAKTWKKIVESYNQANEKIGSMGEMGAKFKQDPITFDVDQYIVEQIVLGYKDFMAAKEAPNRANPKTVTVPKNPTTFVRCWDIGEGGIAYGEFKKNHYDDFFTNGL